MLEAPQSGQQIETCFVWGPLGRNSDQALQSRCNSPLRPIFCRDLAQVATLRDFGGIKHVLNNDEYAHPASQ